MNYWLFEADKGSENEGGVGWGGQGRAGQTKKETQQKATAFAVSGVWMPLPSE